MALRAFQLKPQYAGIGAATISYGALGLTVDLEAGLALNGGTLVTDDSLLASSIFSHGAFQEVAVPASPVLVDIPAEYVTRAELTETPTFEGLDSRLDSVERSRVNAGSLGAAYTLDCAGHGNLLVTGILSANCVLTLTNVAVGAHVVLELSQDGVGGRTLAISHGGDSEQVAIPTAAGAPMQVEIYGDGTDVHVEVGGGYSFTGPQGPVGDDGPQGAPGPSGIGHLQPGFYPSAPHLSNTSMTPVAHRIYITRFAADEDKTIASLALGIITAAVANDSVEVGVYDDAGSLLRSSGLTGGKLNAGASTVQLVALSSPLDLDAGEIYYTAFVFVSAGGGAASLLALSAAGAIGFALLGATVPQVEAGYYQSGTTYPPLPGTLPLLTPTLVANPPFVIPREA